MKLPKFFTLGAIIDPLPVILKNGTLEDADQVMTDLNWIVSQVNSKAGSASGTLGFNILYNPSMQFAQRVGVLGSATFANARGFALDRWNCLTGVGGNASFSQIQSLGLPGLQYALRAHRITGNTSATSIQIAQSMETQDSSPLANQNCVFSFWARAGSDYSPVGSLLTASIVIGTGTDENVLAGYSGQANVAISTITLTTGWARYQVTGMCPSNTNEIAVLLTMNPNGTASTNDYFDFTGAKLELGTGASQFNNVPTPLGVEQVQRYYQKSFPLSIAPATPAGDGIYQFQSIQAGAVASNFSIALATRMRDNGATGVIYNPDAANNQIRDRSANVDFSGCSITCVGMIAEINGTGNAGTSVGNTCGFLWSIDNEL